jgi:hypothetical protein
MAEAIKFSMLGARAAIGVGLIHIEAQVEALEAAVFGNPGLAFDLAKAIIESTCRSILSDRNVSFSPADDLPRLLKATTNNLPFLPVGSAGESGVRKSLVQTISGLNTVVQGVCELRNACGFASHGSDGPRPVLESAQATLAAEAADTIVGFLYRVHRQEITREEKPKLSYETNATFNEYVDDLHSAVRIFEEDFLASKVLFELAPEPYRLYLADYEEQERNSGSDDEVTEMKPNNAVVAEATTTVENAAQAAHETIQ